MQLLIVDDSDLLRKSLAKLTEPYFGKTGLYQAEGVEQAYKLLLERAYDAVVIDIQLPDGSGFDILDFLRRNEINKPVKIVLTNYPNDKFKAKSKELGADYFLDKSSEFGKIIDICKEITEKSGAEIR